MHPGPRSTRRYQVWKGNNRFFCGGRCIFGPDVASLLLSTLMIAGPMILFCYQIIEKITSHVRQQGEGWIHKYHHVLGFPALVVSISLLIADLCFLLLTSSRDPGIVPRNPQMLESSEASDVNTPSMEWMTGRTPRMRFPPSKDVIVNGFSIKLKYCDTCFLYRPPRTSHCSICNNCVQKFDHHCPWVGQCIGIRNYRFFFLFISTSSFLCIFVFSLSLMNILQERKNYHHSILKLILGEIISTLLIVYTFLSIWFVGGLTIFHLYLISTNQTTYENFRYHYDKKDNPFNKGILNNFKEVFFSKIEPSMNNFRAPALEEVAQNGLYAPHLGMDVNSASEKMDIEMGGNMQIATVIHNFDYSSINQNKKDVNKQEGDAYNPLGSDNAQVNDNQRPREYKQSCAGEGGTVLNHNGKLIDVETIVDGVISEGSGLIARTFPANQDLLLESHEVFCGDMSASKGEGTELCCTADLEAQGCEFWNNT
ncbi:hypothetical protein HPP92_018211 [Vanilla planifolia]|uniref:S-acyltransferase n=1 Tax=Vanilla planifolia TaxID=51239 RepID=A0A835UP67_VANPL|nr:hypothetical protein HPP92_018211 [Vanilla planifolia]